MQDKTVPFPKFTGFKSISPELAKRAVLDAGTSPDIEDEFMWVSVEDEDPFADEGFVEETFDEEDDDQVEANQEPVGQDEIGQEVISQGLTRLYWRFDPMSGLDQPFHTLVSYFGEQIITGLDETVLEAPVKAAIRATQIYQEYAERVGMEDFTRPAMEHIAAVLKERRSLLDPDAILPPEAVFEGLPRRRDHPAG